MKKIRDWLPDWFMLRSPKSIQRNAGIGDLFNRKAVSKEQALGIVNLRIDQQIDWLNSIRPKN